MATARPISCGMTRMATPQSGSWNGLQASSAGVGNIATSWSIVGTGDFNGDGMSDIVWRDALGNTAIWLMNGATSRRPTSSERADHVVVADTGDYGGESKAIFLSRDSLGNTAIWFMNGVAVSPREASATCRPRGRYDPPTRSEGDARRAESFDCAAAAQLPSPFAGPALRATGQDHGFLGPDIPATGGGPRSTDRVFSKPFVVGCSRLPEIWRVHFPVGYVGTDTS